MRLELARADDVVRHQRNASFYRYVKPEGLRTRIRPLELFPNGLLIEKTADTIVDSDLGVDFVAPWCDELYIAIDPAVAASLRAEAEATLAIKRRELANLEAQMKVIDSKERGSHANRVKAVKWRVEVLTRGLAEPTATITAMGGNVDAPIPTFDQGGYVQLPSGKPAIFQGLVAGTTTANLTAKVGGSVRSINAPVEVLRDWSSRHLATL